MQIKYFNGQRIRITCSDNIEALRALPANSVHAFIMDSPYGLSNHTPEDVTACLKAWIEGKEYQPKGGGFMNRSWDSWVPGPEFWRECLRALVPGGWLASFAGSRTVDLMGIAIRLAGFEMRDSISWIYSQGFPKSKDLSKALDADAGEEREVVGWKRGIGGENMNDLVRGKAPRQTTEAGAKGIGAYGVGAKQVGVDIPITAPKSELAKLWSGWGTALKPAQEPILLARKPLAGTLVANLKAHGAGGINVDACRVAVPRKVQTHSRSAKASKKENRPVYGEYGPMDTHQNPGQELGLWPPNVILGHAWGCRADGCQPDCPMAILGDKAQFFPQITWDLEKQEPFFYLPKPARKEKEAGCETLPPRTGAEATFREEGTAGLNNPRAGAGRTAEAVHNWHPTVKPIAAMRWLVRLLCPENGLLVDPFLGSGTTAIAAALEGRRCYGLEQNEEYFKIASARLEYWTQNSIENQPQLRLF